jgi:hypothetical protein
MAANRLYPTLQPYPKSCESNIFNQQCAVDMGRLCQTITTRNISALNDGVTSNCRVWRDDVETAYDIDPDLYQSFQNQLDAAMLAYCKGPGVNSTECSCLNFPSTLSDQCKAQGVASRGCDASNIQDCPGKIFTRVSGGYPVPQKDGTTVSTLPYIIVSFDECIPYYCWNDLCWQNNSLLPSWIRGRQQTCSTGVCINVQGVDEITITDLVPPPSAQSFQPRQILMGGCGKGHTTAFPTLIPTQWNTPIDNTYFLPLAITNNGDDILNLVLEDITDNSFKCTVPSFITIGPHGSFNFNVNFDNTLLTNLWTNAVGNDFTQNVTVTKFVGNTPPRTIQSPTFWYSFNSGGTTQVFTFNLEMILRPPVNDQADVQPTVVNKQIPLSVNIVAIVSVAFVLLGILFLLITQKEAIEAYKTISKR